MCLHCVIDCPSVLLRKAAFRCMFSRGHPLVTWLLPHFGRTCGYIINLALMSGLRRFAACPHASSLHIHQYSVICGLSACMSCSLAAKTTPLQYLCGLSARHGRVIEVRGLPASATRCVGVTRIGSLRPSAIVSYVRQDHLQSRAMSSLSARCCFFANNARPHLLPFNRACRLSHVFVVERARSAPRAGSIHAQTTPVSTQGVNHVEDVALKLQISHDSCQPEMQFVVSLAVL